MQKTILIISSNLGGGHRSASEALAQIITQSKPEFTVQIVDISPPLGSITYRFLSNYLTDIFIKNWRAFNNPASAKLLNLLITPLIVPKILPLLRRYSPHIIISTQAFALNSVALSLKQLNLTTPLILVLVDPFSIHHAWTIFKQADLYLLPNQHSFRVFSQRGINYKRLRITGHPIRLIPSATLRAPLTTWRKKLGLHPNKFTIFLGGSGEGVGRLDLIINSLLKQPQLLDSVQIIIACGKNQSLLKQLTLLKKQFPHLLFPYGFYPNMYDLIKAADVVVGKPGPNLMFETIAFAKPFITTSLPLGQEVGNYRFIAKEKLGFITYSPTQTVKKILSIIRQPNLLTQFKPALRHHQRLLRQTPRRCIGALQPFLK